MSTHIKGSSYDINSSSSDCATNKGKKHVHHCKRQVFCSSRLSPATWCRWINQFGYPRLGDSDSGSLASDNFPLSIAVERKGFRR